ncbi:glycine cleavage system protein H, partial [Devosia riboflavina]
LGTGWMYQIRIENLADLDALMDEAAYADFIK